MENFKNCEKGKDVYVIGSGATLNYLDKSFFLDKCTIGVNTVYKRFNCKYLILKHKPEEKAIEVDNILLVKLEGGIGCNDEDIKEIGGISYQTMGMEFSHEPVKHIKLKIPTGREDPMRLAVGYSTIITAMDFARYIGAKNVIMCGCDCGLLDGRLNYEGYAEIATITRFHTDNYIIKKTKKYLKALPIFNDQMKTFADFLRKNKINVLSLNPFINLGLEGHQFKH